MAFCAADVVGGGRLCVTSDGVSGMCLVVPDRHGDGLQLGGATAADRYSRSAQMLRAAPARPLRTMGEDQLANADAAMPHHLYLQDGRLLTWYHREFDDSVQMFRLAGDTDLPVQPIADDVGLALLQAEHRQRDGRLLGPVVEARKGADFRR